MGCQGVLFTYLFIFGKYTVESCHLTIVRSLKVFGLFVVLVQQEVGFSKSPQVSAPFRIFSPGSLEKS